jgi:hypothetical protein
LFNAIKSPGAATLAENAICVPAAPVETPSNLNVSTPPVETGGITCPAARLCSVTPVGQLAAPLAVHDTVSYVNPVTAGTVSRTSPLAANPKLRTVTLTEFS